MEKEKITERLKKEVCFKEDLAEEFNISEREIRRIIAEIAKDEPISSTSYLKGYKIATEPYEIGVLYNSALDLLSRQKQIAERLEPQFKFLAEKSPALEKDYTFEKLNEKLTEQIKYLMFLQNFLKRKVK